MHTRLEKIPFPPQAFFKKNKYILIYCTKTDTVFNIRTFCNFILESVNWIWVSLGDWKVLRGVKLESCYHKGLNPLALLGQLT